MTRSPRVALPSFAGVLLSLAFATGSPAAADTASAARNWRQAGLAGQLVGSAALPAAPLGVIYASQIGSIYRSLDRGATFTRVLVPNDVCPTGTAPLLVADPVERGTLYATQGTGALKTTDGGATWQSIPSPEIGWLVDLQVAAASPTHLLAISDSSVLPPLSPRPPCYPSPLEIGVALSTDAGASWRIPQRPFAGDGTYTGAALDPTHLERLYLGTTNGNVLLSVEGGGLTELATLPTGLPVQWMRVDSASTPPLLYAETAGQLYRAALQPDGTLTSWTSLLQAPLLVSQVRDNVLLDPHQAGTLYAFSGVGVFSSTDRGESWTQINGALDPFSVLGLALDPRPGGPLYAATANGLYALDRSNCVEDDASTCLNGFRYKVQIAYALSGSPAQPGHAQALSADTADFWFFSPGNLELLLKVLDGRALNHAFWVFAGALSDVAYTITVTDTETGAVKTYTNPQGSLASFADTSAFPENELAASLSPLPRSAFSPTPTAQAPARPADSSAAAACTDTGTALCLADSRFEVAVTFHAGPLSGAGQAVPLTGDTGAFWFFSPANLELILKVLDGRSVNGRFWVFYGALSDVAYTIKVTDKTTGAVKAYTNPQGHLASVADTSAF
ncbi:MAG TPA: hypothetical protein VMM92_08945 [Thermoanaerobaculia bacterium]|nr:hypothetical protein [Thermoanaerobaculia bacterium]